MKIFTDFFQPVLTYTVAPSYMRYCAQQDGLKGKLQIAGGVLLVSFLAWLSLSCKNPDFPDWELLVQDILIIGGICCIVRWCQLRFGITVYFYENHFPGGKHSSRYSEYTQVQIERVYFEGMPLVILTFQPKNKRLTREREFGLPATADLDKLTTFLERKGLPVMKSI